MNKNKKTILLDGILLRPLIIGQCAMIQSGKQVFRSSRIISIHELTETFVYFETLSAHYHLATSPLPFAVIKPYSVNLAA